MIPQVSESIFNVENSVVVASCFLHLQEQHKQDANMIPRHHSPTLFASTSYVQITAKTKCEYDSCRHFILLLLQSCLLLLSLVFIFFFLLQFYSSFPISTFFFIFILILLVQKLNAVSFLIRVCLILLLFLFFSRLVFIFSFSYSSHLSSLLPLSFSSEINF